VWRTHKFIPRPTLRPGDMRTSWASTLQASSAQSPAHLLGQYPQVVFRRRNVWNAKCTGKSAFEGVPNHTLDDILPAPAQTYKVFGVQHVGTTLLSLLDASPCAPYSAFLMA